MHFENWISYRYLVASKGKFLSFLNVISIAGVAIGVMALIVVTGVMTGFGNNLREKIIGTTPHIMIEKERGIENFIQVAKELKTIPEVQAASAYIQGNVFLESSGQAVGVAMRGIDPQNEKGITQVDKYLVKGNMADLRTGSVIIGSEMARYFGYRIGDEIVVISPEAGIAGQGWRHKVIISGIFTTGMVDYDSNLIIVDLEQARQILNMPENTVSGIGVKIKKPTDAALVKQKVYSKIGYSFIVRTWIDINRNLFEALFLEKWGLFIILTLMILVASFNIISTLVVTVSSKVHDIGILKSIGASRSAIRRIFTRQGILIGSLGTLLGTAGGFGVSYVLKNYIRVPEEIYSIRHVPVEIQPFDLFMIVLCAFLITFLATIYPAAKAAGMEPVEALRYE